MNQYRLRQWLSVALLFLVCVHLEAKTQASCASHGRTLLKGDVLKSKILDESGKLLEKYKGMEGYAKFAQDHGGAGVKSNMQSVFQNVSAVLDKETFKRLKWQAFKKTVKDFRAYRGKILDADGNLLEKYVGMDGYAKFAQDHGGAGVKSNMQSVFQNVSAVLDKETFKRLKWQAFKKTVKDFRAYRGKILDADGNLLEKYVGMDGYTKFAQDHGGAGDQSKMLPVFKDVSAVLDEKTFKRLNWQQFGKTVEDFHALLDKILDADGNPLEKYVGMDGYAKFAQDHGGAGDQSNMHSVFVNVSAVLDEKTFKRLNWQQFGKTVEDFHALLDKILDADGNPLEKYVGMDGYVKFAQDHGGAGDQSNMHSVFVNVSAVLDEETFKHLKWQKFSKTVEVFRTYRGKILDANGNPLDEYLGMEGYAKFAKDHGEAGDQSNMQSVFVNVSAVLDEETFKRLKWQAFFKTVEIFRTYRGKILDANGNPLDEYLGMEGYAKFAKDHGGAGDQSNMQSVFSNVSAVLDEETFKLLKWQRFSKTVEFFRAYRGKILDADGNPLDKYVGMDGYAKFAKDHGGAGDQSNMQSIFVNVSAVLDEKTFKRLNWQMFSKTVEDFRAYRGKILDADGNPLDEYLGMEGYAKFAEDHGEAGDQSNLQSVFQNVSAVLGGKKEMDRLGLEWKKVQGSVSQYESLNEFFFNLKESDLEKILGQEGQKYVAREIYKGNTLRTYLNVSTLREDLLGGKEAFAVLGWKSKKF